MRAGFRLPGALLVDRPWATPGAPSRCSVTVAYRTNISIRDRSGAIFAVVAVHVLLALALLNLSGRMDLSNGESVMRVFNLAPPPPPPPPPQPQHKASPKPKKNKGASAPLSIKSEASPVMAPKPKIEIPPVPQIAASERPSSGTEATQGASTLEGPGTGAGGSGTGTGSGTSGAGSGGGDNGVSQAPRLITPVLTGKDFPNALLSSWPKGGTVFVRLRVDEHGLVSECAVDHGSGLASIDLEICALAHARLRFSPALNRSGRAVAGWFGYAQRAPR